MTLPNEHRNTIRTQADKKEIARLKEELESCHKAYIAQNAKLQSLRQDIAKLSLEIAVGNQELADELVEQTEIIDKLRSDLAKQAPRIEAAKIFFERMAEADLANHRSQ